MSGKRRNIARRKKEYAGWVWMVLGLTIGLSVAFSIYLSGISRSPPAISAVLEAPVRQDLPDDKEEQEVAAEEAPPNRFDFYSMLPNFEVIVPEQESDVRNDSESQNVLEPGNYVLQAGSFRRFQDADRRRAELALLGIESRVQRVSIDDKSYHRIRIGPLQDLDKLNIIRSRLRQANIDVLRIRVGE